MQKNMKIHGKSMKIDTRKPTFEKRGSEVRFLMDFGYFWGSVGGPKLREVDKKVVQEGTQKTVCKLTAINMAIPTLKILPVKAWSETWI